MATSKRQLAEQAQRLILAGDPTDDRDLSLRELSLYVSQALANIVRYRYFDSKNIGEPHISGSLIFTFDNQQVSLDTAKNLYYVTLPSTSIDLPDDMGVYSVSSQQDQSLVFVPVSPNFAAIYRGTRAEKLDGRYGYWLEGNRIYVHGLNDADCQLLVKMVASVDGISDNQAINIPPDIQEEIVKKTVELYSLQRNEKDVTNDGIE